MRTTSVAPGTTLDPESQELLQGLKSSGRAYDDACARLHALLLRAARFEVNRRRGRLLGADADSIAMEAADDALLAVLRRLDDFRGLSKLTTWAYKFALYEAAVKVRQVQEYRRTAAENGCSLTQLALQFVSGLDGVSVTLIGVSRLDQLESLLATGLPSEAHRHLSALPNLA